MTYYYHGTDSESSKEILANGFDPKRSKFKNGLYFTSNYGEAQKYSKIASGGKMGKVLKVHSNVFDSRYIKYQDPSIFQYSGEIKGVDIKENMNVSAIAGSGDSRLPPDQREPGRKKKLRDVFKRWGK